jgi:hypothetical protein
LIVAENLDGGGDFLEEVGDDLAGVGAGVFGFRGEDEAVGDDVGGEGLDDFSDSSSSVLVA